jgi:hypothetical protein
MIMASEPNSEPERAGLPAGAEFVKLADRFEIMVNSPLPALDGVAGSGYSARMMRGRKADCFALVCAGNVPPRTEAITTLMTLDNPGIMRLLDWGVVDWGGGRRLALILERPLGKRIMTSLGAPIEPLSEDVITRHIIHPMISVLKELSGRAITHGGIRPTNMFIRDPVNGGFTLGECASTPPGIGQPALFEPIERAMAQPMGRGPGSVMDDLYALGVTVLMLALGRNPSNEADDETLLTARIERGSYTTLTAGGRVPQNLIEPLRGLLIDDPGQRWTLSQLELWLSGRRLSPKQTPAFKRASRPLEFAGQEIWHCRNLARVMARNVPAAASLIEGPDLDRWLRRTLTDDARADAMAAAVEGAVAGGGKNASLPDRLVARVAMVMDPTAPIRYKNRAIMPDGLPVALADAFLRREQPQALAEIIAWQLPQFWVNSQSEFRAEFVPMVQTLEAVRNFLERSAIGYGIERVLYEMNPALPCLSPLVQNQWASTPADLLLALDVAAQSRERGRDPIDRHIAAFLAAKNRKNEDALFLQLAPGVDGVRRITATLSILGDVQARFGLGPLPDLCRWMVSLMEPTFQRFNNRPKRQAVRKDADSAAASGKLVDLLRIVDDPDAIKKDTAGFIGARRAHKKAVAEIEKLRDYVADRGAISESTGRQVTATASAVLGTLISAALVLFYFFV